MRVVVVSAHYPPDFVSGGTLVPQRQARALRDRGHDVRVYAGSLDPARQDGGPWDEADETGVPVHWVPVRHAIGWADRANHDDPRACAQFEAWLEQVRPDVVHLHSLQSLGGGLVAGTVDVEPFTRPPGEALHDAAGDAGVLDDLVALPGAGGYNAVGVALDDLLVQVGGLVPFLEPLHALGEGKLLEREGGVADVDALGGLLAVEAGRVKALAGDDGLDDHAVLVLRRQRVRCE